MFVGVLICTVHVVSAFLKKHLIFPRGLMMAHRIYANPLILYWKQNIDIHSTVMCIHIPSFYILSQRLFKSEIYVCTQARHSLYDPRHKIRPDKSCGHRCTRKHRLSTRLLPHERNIIVSISWQLHVHLSKEALSLGGFVLGWFVTITPW